MQEKIVSSQKALDELIESDFDGLIIIKNTIEEIDICKNGKASINVSGSAKIGSVSGSAQIRYVSGSAKIGSVSGSAQIRSVSGSAQIRSVSGSAQIRYVSGSAQIRYVSGSAQIGSVSGNGLLNIYSKDVLIKSAQDRAILICYQKPVIKKKGKNVQIVKTAEYKETTFSVNKFIDKYAVVKEGKSIILYKSVKDDYCDNYTGKIKYEVGKTIICPDWNPSHDQECGGGLHLSPTPYFALQFHDGKVLKCRVKIEDCITTKSPQYPHKLRCKEVEVLEEVKNLF